MSARSELTEAVTPERIRVALALHRVKATELAHEVGLHPTVLSRILNEREHASGEFLQCLHRGLLAIALRRGPAEPQETS